MSVLDQESVECAFSMFPAAKKLRDLAKNPYDLTREGHLSPERVKECVAQAAGIKLLFATQRVSPEVLKALEELAEQSQAVEKMRKMQAGERMNRIDGFDCDNRSVLHTAMRDLFANSQTAEPAAAAVTLAKAEHQKLRKFLKGIEGKEYTDLVMVGIGGSDLGPRCLYLSLEAFRQPHRRCHFISNVDPDDCAEVLAKVDLKKTLFAVVSKSGSTLETKTNEELVRGALRRAGCTPEKHILAVTGKGSPMDNPQRYRESFYIWDFVGGRFCTTSLAGGLPLAFGLGYEAFESFLQGCHEMDQVALRPQVRDNLPLLLALLGVWNRNFLNYPTLGVVPYSQALHRFAAHLQQVDMESNGKRIEQKGRAVDFATGPIVLGEPGTNAQHSFYQLIHQGTDVVPMELIGFQQCQRGEDTEVEGSNSQEKLIANLLAQCIALARGQNDDNPNKVFPGNRPSTLILAKQLTPHTMGALWALYEHKVAFQGFIWGINSFDQEGVQLGKVLAKKVLRCLQERRNSGSESYPIGDAFVDELMDLD